MHPLAGRKQSPEHIAKRMEAWHKSEAPVKAGQRFREMNLASVGSKQSDERKAKISAAMMGKRNSLGVPKPMELRKRLSEYWKDNPAHNHWVDGKGAERSSERVKEMGRLEYRLWREAVFKRDNYTCLHCGKVGGLLNADHIKPYATHPALRLDVGNGQTLCRPCHMKTPTWGSKALRFKDSSTSSIETSP